MFEEIEKEAKTTNKESEFDIKKLFAFSDATNGEVGQKIKWFAKIFLIIQIVILALGVFASFIFTIAMLSETDGISIFIGLGVDLALALAFVLNYYLFLIISGFGGLVEDTNAIKNSVKTSKSAKK